MNDLGGGGERGEESKDKICPFQNLTLSSFLTYSIYITLVNRKELLYS